MNKLGALHSSVGIMYLLTYGGIYYVILLLMLDWVFDTCILFLQMLKIIIMYISIVFTTNYNIFIFEITTAQQRFNGI